MKMNPENMQGRTQSDVHRQIALTNSRIIWAQKQGHPVTHGFNNRLPDMLLIGMDEPGEMRVNEYNIFFRNRAPRTAGALALVSLLETVPLKEGTQTVAVTETHGFESPEHNFGFIVYSTAELDDLAKRVINQTQAYKTPIPQVG